MVAEHSVVSWLKLAIYERDSFSAPSEDQMRPHRLPRIDLHSHNPASQGQGSGFKRSPSVLCDDLLAKPISFFCSRFKLREQASNTV